MKQKTEWGHPLINTTLDRWVNFFSNGDAFFHNDTNLQWVNFYSRKVANTLEQRAGRIIGDEE